MCMVVPPPWQRSAIATQIARHSEYLVNSYITLVGRPLLNPVPASISLAQALFEAPFVVVSHGTEADPILNYGNQTALDLWQRSWEQFTQTPSRYTAEPIERVERDRLLTQAKTQGYISDYSGIRITSQGQRFWIENAVIWTVYDEAGATIGQAATFQQWRWIMPS